MKKIGFIGAFDKSNFIIYTAKLLELSGYKVLVVDATSVQKIKYIVPSVNPTKSYVTSFENIDFAIGFENWKHIEDYLGIELDTDDENIDGNPDDYRDTYDYVLLDIDSSEKIQSFNIESAYKNYFVTSFDMFSLRKGIAAFQELTVPMNLTKILFSYESTREDEEYLNYVSMEYRINWNEYTLYFRILGDDNKVFEENQRLEKIRFRRLSPSYKESLVYVVQDIDQSNNITQLRRAMKE